MLKGLVLVLCLSAVQGAVIRNEGNPVPDPLLPEATTAAVILDQQEEGITTTEESTTLAAPAVALSRDEEASILIDPAPGTLQEDEPSNVQKSGKLLLLSTPPKRHHEIERQLEEQDDDEDEADAEPTTTEQPKDNEQEQQQEEKVREEEREEEKKEEASATTESSTTPATTRLFAIDATPAEKDSSPANVAVSLSQDNATISIAEEPQVPGDNNAAVELALVEPEAEYVLLDDDEVHDELDLQLGSFTHIDSDVRLQPVVHSVEIVPTSLDDPLIVNYVHNLR
ncbi:hypothetical protein KR032_002862 [Drosophila birchii]|nr:hypothetical protein KR032_002862 [Drosophila birchii]